MSEDLKVSGTFKRGLRIGDKLHQDFTLRACTAADYFAAEATCPDAAKSITFRSALAVSQLERIGDFEGPFTLSMLGKLTPSDLNILLAKRDEVELLGEAEQPA